MLCTPLDWQYAYLPSSVSGRVMCSVFVRKIIEIRISMVKCGTSKQIEKKEKQCY